MLTTPLDAATSDLGWAVAAVSGGNKKLESVVRTNGSNRHNLTYGEVRARLRTAG